MATVPLHMVTTNVYNPREENQNSSTAFKHTNFTFMVVDNNKEALLFSLSSEV